MSNTYVQLLPVDEALPVEGMAASFTGPDVAPGPPPALSTLWPTPLTGSSLFAAGSTVQLTLDAALAADPVLVETVVRLGATGEFLTVGGWLRVGAWVIGTQVYWSLRAELGIETLASESSLLPIQYLKPWPHVQVVISADQLALIVDGSVRIRLPIADRFTVPSSLTEVTVGNEDPGRDLAVAVVMVTDSVPPSVDAAVSAAESVGRGEVRGAFYRAGEDVVGGEAGPEVVVPGGRHQPFHAGSGYWTSRSGAVVLTGPVWERYVDLGEHASVLGLPITDTQPGTAPYAVRSRDAAPSVAGDDSQMARFEHGIIAWSPETGVREVLGRVAAHWLLLGGPTSVVGLPVGPRTETPHGYRHGFQFGDVFERYDGTVAEVHGGILERYDKEGAWDGPLGSPLTDEEAVRDDSGNDTGARLGRFEHGGIVADPAAGVHLLQEPWWTAYQEEGGPGGPLGAPTSEPVAAGGNGVTYVTFEHGFLVNHAMTGIRRVQTIEVTLSEAEAPSIDDGVEFDWGIPSADHDAELIVWMSVLVDGVAVPGLDRRRFPDSGYAGRSVSMGNVGAEVAVDPATVITVVGEAEDHDDLSSDDALGGITRTYGIDTIWGEVGPLGPAYSETGSGGDGAVTYSYAIGLPSGPISADFRADRWWCFVNKGTDDLGYNEVYARAFEDVEAHGGVWDTVTNPLDHLFYELAIRGVAEKGNCFGMGNLATRALFDTNQFRLPLSRYGTAKMEVSDPMFPGPLRTVLNIAQAQQLDAAVVSEVLDQISFGVPVSMASTLTGIGDVRTGGDLAVLSMMSVFEGKGHAVLAYGYEPRPGFPDSILIADPNVPSATAADRHVSRIELDNVGGWQYFENDTAHADYASAKGALLFRIPSRVVRERSVTPMAALALGVAQILSSLILVGGEADLEHAGLGQGSGTLTRVPLLQASPLTRLYAGQGPIPNAARAVLVSRGRADAGVLFRTANVTAGATIRFDEPHVIADVRVDGFDGIRPTLVSSVNADLTAADLHLGTIVGRAQRPGWAARATVHLDRSGPASFGLAPLGVGVVLDGLADGPAPEVELQRLDAPTRSRFVLTDYAPGRRVELRPADMASPFGAQVLTGLGTDIIVTPSI